MNLYLIRWPGSPERSAEHEPCAYYEAVVVASCTIEASCIHPNGAGRWSHDNERWESAAGPFDASWAGSWAPSPADVVVVKIGVSDTQEAGVVCAALNPK